MTLLDRALDVLRYRARRSAARAALLAHVDIAAAFAEGLAQSQPAARAAADRLTLDGPSS